MPKGKTRKTKKPDPLELRFHLLVRRDLLKTLTAKRYNEVYRQWVLTGELPDGFKVPPNAAEWRNSARRSPELRTWRTGDNQEAIRTLLRRSLPAIQFQIVEVPQEKRRFAKPKPKRRKRKKIPRRGRTGAKPK